MGAEARLEPGHSAADIGFQHTTDAPCDTDGAMLNWRVKIKCISVAVPPKKATLAHRLRRGNLEPDA